MATQPPTTKPPLPSNSDAWPAFLKPWILRRIDVLRDDLERDGVNVDLTRGRIAELRNIIAAVEPDAPATTPIRVFPGEE